MKPTAFHNCLAWHMRCAEPERILSPPRPFPWGKLLLAAGVPAVSLILFATDVGRAAVAWWMS
jgi:hypothetical protein